MRQGDEKDSLVRPSQSVSTSPLNSPAEKCGTIVCSHCTCKGDPGAREACSHIAALLFAVEAHNSPKDMSCMSQLCA